MADDGKVERMNQVISSYIDEEVQGEYVSTTGGLDAGATVVYTIATPIVEQYDPQPMFALCGTVNVTQEPVDLVADLSATMLVGRGEGI